MQLHYFPAGGFFKPCREEGMHQRGKPGTEQRHRKPQRHRHVLPIGFIDTLGVCGEKISHCNCPDFQLGNVTGSMGLFLGIIKNPLGTMVQPDKINVAT